MKGTFNQGWWNCFESFTAELLSSSPAATDIATRVLDGAGITEREAASWLERTECTNLRVVEIVREYWLHLR